MANPRDAGHLFQSREGPTPTLWASRRAPWRYLSGLGLTPQPWQVEGLSNHTQKLPHGGSHCCMMPLEGKLLPQPAKDSSFSLQGEEYKNLTDTFREKERKDEGPEQAG